MTDYTKSKITFSLALLGALFALGPILQSIGDVGYQFLKIQISIGFAYSLFMGLLGLTVYFYAVDFITERPIFNAKKIANVSYGSAIIVPPLYIALFLVVRAVQFAGSLIEIEVIIRITTLVLTVLLSLLSVYLIRSFARRLGIKDRRSEIQQLANQQVAFLSQAAKLFDDKYYTQTVIECFKIIELAIRKALIALSISFRPTMTDMLAVVVNNEIISPETADVIDGLRELRNKAVHTEKQISRRDAASALKVTKGILSLLESKEMIELGLYQTDDGKVYDCQFMPIDNIAEAIGPLPEGGQVGARGVAFRVRANSEDEAKKKLAAKIGPGRFM